jgi:hypothetical protein
LIPEKLKQKYPDETTPRPQTMSIQTMATRTHNPYEKRKSSRKSIWKLAMEQTSDKVDRDISLYSKICTCGSQNVTVNGNVSSGYSHIAKAETWGFKDRSEEVIERLMCSSCGKTWNNEE